MSYAQKVEEQINQYANREALKGLPDIYQYWSQKYVKPALEDIFGSSNIYQIYAEQFLAARKYTNNSTMLSIGSGDCVHEVEIVKKILSMGERGGFRMICTDLAELRLRRGIELAEKEGVSEYMDFKVIDVNNWVHEEKYGLIFAQHTLHHVLELEQLFDHVESLLEDEGIFFTIDMIGRNGHMRWPEVHKWVDLIWETMPDHYRYNHQFEKYHEKYLNWDCSVRGFEGIRAQDILPLLVEKFDFSHFFACGGVEEVFVDRGYGHNLVPGNQKDEGFIDLVHELNEWLLDSGSIKPTMIFAAMMKRAAGQKPACRVFRNRYPADAIRHVGADT